MQDLEELTQSIAVPLADRLERLQQPDGGFQDPLFGYRDPRPAAETALGFLRLGRREPASRAIGWLLEEQNPNGSWSEILPDQSEESSLASAIVGRLLLEVRGLPNQDRCRAAAFRAGDYVLSREFSPGYFIKSVRHYTDVLNVNATCGAFLQTLYQETRESRFAAARDRAIFHTVRWQFKDGSFPYGCGTEAFPDEWHLHVRDPHYHAITFHFLLKADSALENPYLRVSAPRALAWLEAQHRPPGVDWARCRLLFSLGTTAAYAYSARCFAELGRPKAARGALVHLKKLQEDGAFKRFEPSRASEALRGLFREAFDLEYSNPAVYPWPLRIRRSFLRARRELFERRNSRFSLYYSAQILECLTGMGRPTGGGP